MIKIFSTLAAFCFCINIVFTQNTVDPFQVLIDNGNISTTFFKRDSKIEGSPYVTEEFSPARISILGNKIYFAKYNAFHDEIAVKAEDGIVYSLRKNSINDVIVTYIISKKTYQIFNYLDERNNQDSGFFIPIGNNDLSIKLLKKEKIVFIGAKKTTSNYAQAEPSQYKRVNDKYFIKIGDNDAILLPRNKKEFARLFDEKEQEVLSFIKKEKLKLNRVDDLTKLISFLNSLSLS